MDLVRTSLNNVSTFLFAIRFQRLVPRGLKSNSFLKKFFKLVVVEKADPNLKYKKTTIPGVHLLT
jgi:hypothetical protein